jgi:hypothetical protein
MSVVIGALRRRIRVGRSPPPFDPCLPRLVDRPPEGAGWIHEIKHDGFRITEISVPVSQVSNLAHTSRPPLSVRAEHLVGECRATLRERSFSLIKKIGKILDQRTEKRQNREAGLS